MMRSSPFAMPTLAGLVAACLLPSVALAQERQVNVVMQDQFSNHVETAQMRGDVVVLVYAGRHGAEAAVELGRTLHTRFHPSAEVVAASEWSTQPVVGLAGWPAGLPVPDVRVIPVACVPEVPKALHGMVRRRLKRSRRWCPFGSTLRT